RLAYLDRGHANPLEGGGVQREIALQREDADGTRPRRRAAASQASATSAFLSGGNTGYQPSTMRPPSTYHAIRSISVVGPPRSTGYSNVGSVSARVRARRASLRMSKGM